MASTDLRKHEESKVHRMAATQYVEAKRMQETGDSISQQLSRAYNSEVQLNRRNVKYIFELILLFGRQGIVYRGHDECSSSLNCGNLLVFTTVIKLENVPNLLLTLLDQCITLVPKFKMI